MRRQYQHRRSTTGPGRPSGSRVDLIGATACRLRMTSDSGGAPMSETEPTTAADGTEAEMTSEATPSIEWIRDFLLQWQDAWNSHEVERVLALMTEDVEYRDDSWPKPMRGHADVR